MIRVALVGLGDWGKTLLRTLQPIPDFRVTVLCDRHAENRQTAQTLCPNAKAIVDLSSLPLAREADLTVISTGASSHFPLAKMALEQGTDVFVEKPLVLSAHEGE